MASSPSKQPPRREDRRRARTRTALIGAGQKLFADNHIDGVTIDEIVDAADVAKGSFYNHFEDKESLADTIVELVQGDCEREIYTANQDIEDAAVRMARAMMTLIRYAQEHPDRYHAMVNLTERRAHIDSPLNAGLRHDIKHGLVSGVFTDMSVEGGMLAAFGAISTAIDYLASATRAGEPGRMAREMGFVMLRALGVPANDARSIASTAAGELLGAKAPRQGK
ncbi:MAG: TetR/AcrR family transcriptional regulator [Alphaproteobacteria bacterium]|nr:TetR/AcrR family transcriptional regulator [Alphaproteobacteria bacterium]MDE2339800.1 helix-turn-helix transcriptional regulator [Alphaproteobacteria bacterium]